MAKSKLFLFGAPRLEQDGAPVTFDTRKAMALLAYLVVTNAHVTRDTLTGLFWPEYSQSRARANLRRTLSTLAKGLGQTSLDTESDTVGLRPDSGLWVDVLAFSALLAEAAPDHTGGLPALTQAMALYQADFMAGFTLRDSPAFEEWHFFQSETFRQQAAAGFERLAQAHATQAEFDAAIGCARRRVALNPLDEAAQRQLMQLYAWSGQRNAALRQYKTLVELLDNEFGAPPAAETEALAQAIHANQLPPPVETDLPPTVLLPPPAASPLPRHNLPAQTTLFVGRQAELADLARLLAEPTCRLITLGGLGGIGKTRLALEFAAARLPDFADGVWFVPLAPITQPEAAVSCLSEALALSLGGPLAHRQQLLDYLRPKHMLLILDNLEHLLPADNGVFVTLISDIVQAAPGVSLLVTSRERLALRGEWVVWLDGLPVPPPDAAPEDIAEDYATLRLFQHHAQRQQPRLQFSADEVAAMADICRMMHGVPLGIELAAAWTRLLSCREIAGEIARNIDFLTVTTRDVPERQRSLRAAFEYSWHMLPAPERDVFARLSVFRGGFQRQAAVVVAGASLPLLAGLVDKSLLHVTAPGRYEVHELLRQYAAEKLWLEQSAQPVNGPHSGVEALWQRYAGYYLDLLRRQAPHLRGESPQQALAELRAELDNLRQAWGWLVNEAHFEALREGLPGLAHFYDLSNLFQEGEAVFQAAITCLQAMDHDSLPPAARLLLAELHLEQARLLTRRGQTGRAIQLTHIALELTLAGADRAVEIKARRQLGEALNFQGRYVEGQVELAQALKLAQAPDVAWLLPEIRRDLAISAVGGGDYSRAKTLLEQALADFQAGGDRRNQAVVLLNLGVTAHGLQDYDTARRHTEAAVRTFRDVFDHWGELTALNNLGFMAYEFGDYGQARATLQAAQRSPAWQEYHIEPHFWHTLGNLSRDLGDFDSAAEAYGRCLELGSRVEDRHPRVLALADSALLLLYQGQPAAALAQAQQAVVLCAEIGLRAERALALTHQGQALAALNRVDEARQRYQQALDLRCDLGQMARAVTPLAGLALLHLAAGEAQAAGDAVDQILPHLADDRLVGIDQPWWVLWVCCRVLQANRRPDAPTLAARARALLRQRAAQIPEAALRDSFLRRIPAHRYLLACNLNGE